MNQASHTFPRRGRGTGLNPSSRFAKCQVQPEERDPSDDSTQRIKTQFFVDASRSILASNDSPDIGFTYSLNPYRGCEHGCVYCYARPTHEYLGFSAGEDFETKIMVKEQAPELLRKKLASKSWKPEPIAMSGVTDCYQPAEKKFQLTRRCLQILAEFRNPVFIITKNHLVTRDIDVLSDLASDRAALVIVSLTTLDAELCATLEPRTARPQHRLDAIKQLSQAGIPVAVNLAPVIPGLTDEEIPRILAAAYEAGARNAGYTPLRLPYGVKDIFEDWARRTLPDRADKIIHRVRSLRGGELNDPNFGSRMRGEGIFAQQIGALFKSACKKQGFNQSFPTLSTAAFRKPQEQMKLF